MKQKVFGIIGAVVALIAMAVASTASFWLLHQPKEPKCLR